MNYIHLGDEKPWELVEKTDEYTLHRKRVKENSITNICMKIEYVIHGKLEDIKTEFLSDR